MKIRTNSIHAYEEKRYILFWKFFFSPEAESGWTREKYKKQFTQGICDQEYSQLLESLV
ncbi:MAG: hypothetical protein V1733_06030 [bacterium]